MLSFHVCIQKRFAIVILAAMRTRMWPIVSVIQSFLSNKGDLALPDLLVSVLMVP